MKFAARTLVSLAFLGATFAHTQTNILQVQHVIVVIQENRTPTNLFHEDATLIANGAHVRPPNDMASCGPILQNPVRACTPAPMNTNIQLTGLSLAANFGPKHGHYPDWQCTFNNGGMNGSCHVGMNPGNYSTCPSGKLQYCPYTFVADSPAIQPYFQIAEQFGFANWMFQTNQGPSQPAHLFLFAGTSAPDYYDNDKTYGQYWVAENGSGDLPGGCLAAANKVVFELPPAPPQWPQLTTGYTPPGGTPGYPCWNPNTLATLLDPAHISWRYYANVNGEAYWNAPVSIYNICVPNSIPARYARVRITRTTCIQRIPGRS